MILNIINLLGALGMFLFGMNMMTNGLQKTVGSGMTHFLSKLTSNPLKGVVTGFGVTSIIQSSSATSVMVVGFVNAGLLTLRQAIGVIMGANIGTTMTAWIVAVFGFSMDIAVVAVPLMAVGFICSVSKKSKWRDISWGIIGFSLLFLGLSFMKSSVPDLSGSPEILSFVQNFSGYGVYSVLLFVLIGAILTLVLQSSSATIALTLIFLNMQWIGFDMAAAMVLGENIGTTITANIAAVMGNTASKRAALAHTVFNLFGVVWAVALFKPLVSTILSLTDILGLNAGGQTSYLFSVALLHTMFNLINTSLLIWFIPQIEKLVCRIIRTKNEEKPGKLVYLNAGLVSIPELAIPEVDKEILHFGEIMKKGMDYIQSAISVCDDKDKFEPLRVKLVDYEEISDRIEYEILSFLNKLDRSALSADSNKHLLANYRIAGEMESLGDSGESISRLIARSINSGQQLSEEHKAKVSIMGKLIGRAYESMIWNLANRHHIKNINNAINAEIDINAYRNEVRETELKSIADNNLSYFDSYLFLELMDSIEQMGDFIINISQALVDNNG